MVKPRNVIEIIGHTHNVRLALLYRDFPEANNAEDSDWVTTNFWLDIPQRPTRFTYSLHLDDLRRFEQELLNMRHEQQGRAVLAMREEYLRLEAVLSAGGALHWWVTAQIPNQDRSTNTILPTMAFDFEADPSSWLTALDQVKAVLKQTL